MRCLAKGACWSASTTDKPVCRKAAEDRRAQETSDGSLNTVMILRRGAFCDTQEHVRVTLT